MKEIVQIGMHTIRAPAPSGRLVLDDGPQLKYFIHRAVVISHREYASNVKGGFEGKNIMLRKFGWIAGGLIVTSIIYGLSIEGIKRSRDHLQVVPSTALVTRRDISSFVRATGIIQPKTGAEVRAGSRISGIIR